jgi:phosphate uptake regulator
METRKVQKTGKSTLNVSLPKNWANANGISNGSLIFITQNQNGNLLLAPDRSEWNLVVRIDIGSKSGDPLIRDVIACYLAGYRTLEIYSHKMTAMQKNDIHSIVNKLIGPEVLEETVDKIIIRDLLSSEELNPDHVLKRIKNMTRSMIQDAISSIVEKNKELAIDVIQRDSDVDRLNLLISRQFSEILSSGSMEQEINPIIAFNYMQAAINLERIADHASKIAEMSLEIECDLPVEIAEKLSKFGSIFPSLMDESIYVLLNPDNHKANQIIDRSIETKRQLSVVTRSFSDKCDDDMLIRLAAAGSIERILDHIINISELAINLYNATLRKEIQNNIAYPSI